MRDRNPAGTWRPLMAGLVALVSVAGAAFGQQSSSTSSSQQQSKGDEPVVRTYGTEGGYRTEVTSRTKGTLSEEDRRQVSLLAAQIFQHIDAASEAIDADDTKPALEEVNKGLEAIKAIRTMLPKTEVHTRTTAPDGKVVYEDRREVQEGRVPVYEGMLHTETLAPILAARRNALEVAGVTVVKAQSIATEAVADIDTIEGQLKKAAKALQANKPQDAAKALALALIRGIDIRFNKDDTALAAARDAIWLARRSLEENNVAQALANLAVARQRLKIYREVASADQRQEVDQLLGEVDQLEGQLRQEGTRTATRSERARQGSVLAQWWDRVNGWFRRHF